MASDGTSASNSLQGIVNSNPDPNACALCSEDLKRWSKEYDSSSSLVLCCGADFCVDCLKHLKHLIDGPGTCCVNCGSQCYRSDLSLTARNLKKLAKKGHPWAQFQLGCSFADGTVTMQSSYEAIRWFRKSAAQGHPFATAAVGRCYLEGFGCDVDLAEARRLTEHAVSLDLRPTMTDEYEKRMLKIAQAHRRQGNLEEAKDILMPLSTAIAQFELGSIFMNEENFTSAFGLFEACAMAGHVLPAWNLVSWNWDDSKFAKANVWLKYVKNNIQYLPAFDPKKDFVESSVARVNEGVRELRYSCATCAIPLDRSNRKLCRGCRTFCYCSVDCQKQHWDKAEDEGGHRSECKEAQALIELMKGIPSADSVSQVLSGALPSGGWSVQAL